jgi:hypothetical protein
MFFARLQCAVYLPLLIQTFHYYHPNGAAPLGTPGLATICSPLPRRISDRSNFFRTWRKFRPIARSSSNPTLSYSFPAFSPRRALVCAIHDWRENE